MIHDKKNYSADDYKNGNYIVKEAQMVIDEYIKKHNPNLVLNLNSNKNYEVNKKKNEASRRKISISPFLVFNCVVFILITAFLYLLSKVI